MTLNRSYPTSPILPPTAAYLPVVTIASGASLPFILSSGGYLCAPIAAAAMLIYGHRIIMAGSLPDAAIADLMVSNITAIFPAPVAPTCPTTTGLMDCLGALNMNAFVNSCVNNAATDFACLLALIDPATSIASLTADVNTFAFTSGSSYRPIVGRRPVALRSLLPIPPANLAGTRNTVLLAGKRDLSGVTRSADCAIAAVSNASTAGCVRVVGGGKAGNHVRRSNVSVAINATTHGVTLRS